jgi:hypothetical protein
VKLDLTVKSVVIASFGLSGEIEVSIAAIFILPMFKHPKQRATLAIRLDENFSTSAILRRLEECEKKYGDHT